MKVPELLLLGFLQILLGITIAAIVFAMVGCGTTTRTKTTERFKVDGTAGGLPVEGTMVRESESHEETVVNAPEVAQTFGAAASLASAVTPVGVGGTLVGIAGMAAAWFFRNKAKWSDDAFVKTHSAAEAAMAELPDDARDIVARRLGETLDRDEKQRIAKAKALA